MTCQRKATKGTARDAPPSFVIGFVVACDIACQREGKGENDASKTSAMDIWSFGHPTVQWKTHNAATPRFVRAQRTREGDRILVVDGLTQRQHT